METSGSFQWQLPEVGNFWKFLEKIRKLSRSFGSFPKFSGKIPEVSGNFEKLPETSEH